MLSGSHLRWTGVTFDRRGRGRDHAPESLKLLEGRGLRDDRLIPEPVDFCLSSVDITLSGIELLLDYLDFVLKSAFLEFVFLLILRCVTLLCDSDLLLLDDLTWVGNNWSEFRVTDRVTHLSWIETSASGG